MSTNEDEVRFRERGESNQCAFVSGEREKARLVLRGQQLAAGHRSKAFVTTAAGAGVYALETSDQTRHKSLDMVRRYTRPATICKSDAAFRVGL